jgi:hypothetical protein
MTRGDKCLAAGIMLAAILAIAFPRLHSSLFPMATSSARAVIKAQGKIDQEVDLSDRGGRSTFVVNGRVGPSTLEVEGKRIRMKEANCPDKICVRQGWIEKPGDSIVCIPGEIIIRIEGAAPVDAVTR